MSYPAPTCHELRRDSGARGRVLVVGDIHGEYDMFMRLLKHARYNDMWDTVYSLGDVIDRGPESLRTLEWFAGRRRAYMLMGNHEAMMMQADEDYQIGSVWLHNGGGWAHSLGARELYLYRCMLRALPLTAEIDYDTGAYLVGLVHADVPSGLAWKRMKRAQTQTLDAIDDWRDTASVQAIWGRRRFKADLIMRRIARDQITPEVKVRVWQHVQPVRGVDLLVCGHTVLDDFVPRGRANVLWIETGAAYGGRLTAVDPVRKVYWQVGHTEGEVWGPLPLPALDPVSRAYRPTRVDIEAAAAADAQRRGRLGPLHDIWGSRP
ncbi:MAG: metallophosphoesterase [Sinimarinibacterium sp.]|jgi:serine/threonine protein phosphatase 1